MNRRDFIKRGALFVPAIFIPKIIRAAPAFANPAFFHAKPAAGGGGGVTWTLIDHVGQNGSSGDTTSPSINSSAANFLIVPFNFSGGTVPAISDTYSNTWALSSGVPAFNPRGGYYYCLTPNVGAGHTVTLTHPSSFSPSLQFFAFSRSGGSPSLDVEATVGSSGSWHLTTVRCGVISPTTGNDIFFSSVYSDVPSGVTASVDSSFILLNSTLNTGGYVLATGYKIKSGDSSSEQPGWSEDLDKNADANVVGIAFK